MRALINHVSLESNSMHGNSYECVQVPPLQWDVIYNNQFIVSIQFSKIEQPFMIERAPGSEFVPARQIERPIFRGKISLFERS